MREMNEKIKIIEDMLQRKSFEADVFYKLLESFEYEIPKLTTLLSGIRPALRSRKNDGILFYNVNELNCPPKEKARTDRASLKNNPMFYASIHDTTEMNSDQMPPRLISVLETMDILRDYNSKGTALVTESKWIIHKPLHLFAFPFCDNYAKPCALVKRMKNLWNRVYRKKYNKEDAEFAEYIGRLMGTPYNGNKCLYEITSHLVDYIINQEEQSFDGVLYPSVQGEGQGVNICLKEDAANKCVRFEIAKIEMIVKEQGHATLYPIGDSKRDDNDNLSWVLDKKAVLQFREYEPFCNIDTSKDIIIVSKP